MIKKDLKERLKFFLIKKESVEVRVNVWNVFGIILNDDFVENLGKDIFKNESGGFFVKKVLLMGSKINKIDNG